MTRRSIAIGLFAAGVICAVTHFNSYIMRSGLLVGHYLPPVVFAPLVLFVLLANPALNRIRGSWALSGQELTVVVVCALFACFVPGGGLMSYFTDVLVMPHHLSKTYPEWHGDAPALRVRDVTDWPEFVVALREGGQRAGTVAARLWQRFPAELQNRVRAAADTDEITPGLREDVVAATNLAVMAPDFYQKPDFAKTVLPPYVKGLLRRRREQISETDCHRLNRWAIDVAFPRCVRRRHLGAVEACPRQLLVEPGTESENIVTGFVSGLSEGDRAIAPGQIPWYAWQRPLRFWLPLIAAMCALVVGLSLVVHRQWAHHECLPYPIAEVASRLMPNSTGEPGAAFHDRLFWFGFIPVILIYANNYACAWWADYLVPVRLTVDFMPMTGTLLPWLTTGFIGLLNRICLSFCIIGITYFLRTDVSFSFGLSAYLSAVLFSGLALFGIKVEAESTTQCGHLLFSGAFAGIFVTVLYTGRRHYITVLRRCLGLKAEDKIGTFAVWGGRLALIATMVVIIYLVRAGLEWQLAVLYTFFGILTHVALSRIIAETGIFLYKPLVFPSAFIFGFLGGRALGPHNVLLLVLITCVLFISPMNALMPFVCNALKLADAQKVRVGKAATAGFVALAIGIPVAFCSTLYLKYQYGAWRAGEGWTVNNIPRFAFQEGYSATRMRLAADGSLAASDHLSGWSRFRHASVKRGAAIGFAITFFLTVAFKALRIRFPRWPLHPVLLVGLALSWVNCWIASALLIGCFVKFVVTRYGGAKLYERLKPLMIGLIAGEIVAAFMPLVIGAIVYALTGRPPKSFTIFPA